MGFTTTEEMRGQHEFREDWGPRGQHPFAFRLTWGPQRVREWLNPASDRFMWQEAQGDVLIGGLCDWTRCVGTLKFEYLTRRRIRYEFDFDVAGKAFHFVGDKVNIRPWNLAVSHTTCFGTLTELETGNLVSTSVSHFRMRDLPRLVGGIRPR